MRGERTAGLNGLKAKILSRLDTSLRVSAAKALLSWIPTKEVINMSVV